MTNRHGIILQYENVRSQYKLSYDTLSVCVLVMLRLSDEATCNKSDQTLFLTSLSSQEIQD